MIGFSPATPRIGRSGAPHRYEGGAAPGRGVLALRRKVQPGRAGPDVRRRLTRVLRARLADDAEAVPGGARLHAAVQRRGAHRGGLASRQNPVQANPVQGPDCPPRN